MQKASCRMSLLVLLCIIVSFFSACESVKEEKRIVIAVSTIGETHGWPVGVRFFAEREIKAVAAENGWDYQMLVAQDANEQSNQVIELVNQEVDCIIMLPMDGASLKTAAMAIEDADIPLVIFDREIPDFAPTATVKGDNSGIGSMTADIFNGYFPDGTKVLEVMGDTSTVPQQRTDGFDEIIHKNIIKEQVGFTGWSRGSTKRLFGEWIEVNSEAERAEVGAIFTHDDEIALGILDVLDELEAEGKSNMMPNLRVIAGSAGPQMMYRRIAEEKQYELFSLIYSPAMICEAIEIGANIILGEEYEEMTIIGTKKVSKENVKEYIDPSLPY